MSSDTHKQCLMLLRHLKTYTDHLYTIIDKKWDKLSDYEQNNIKDVYNDIIVNVQALIGEKELND